MFQRGHAIDYGQEYHGKMSTVDQRKCQIQNINKLLFDITFVQEMIRSTKMGEQITNKAKTKIKNIYYRKNSRKSHQFLNDQMRKGRMPTNLNPGLGGIEAFECD